MGQRYRSSSRQRRDSAHCCPRELHPIHGEAHRLRLADEIVSTYHSSSSSKLLTSRYDERGIRPGCQDPLCHSPGVQFRGKGVAERRRNEHQANGRAHCPRYDWTVHCHQGDGSISNRGSQRRFVRINLISFHFQYLTSFFFVNCTCQYHRFNWRTVMAVMTWPPPSTT